MFCRLSQHFQHFQTSSFRVFSFNLRTNRDIVRGQINTCLIIIIKAATIKQKQMNLHWIWELAAFLGLIVNWIFVDQTKQDICHIVIFLHLLVFYVTNNELIMKKVVAALKIIYKIFIWMETLRVWILWESLNVKWCWMKSFSQSVLLISGHTSI